MYGPAEPAHGVASIESTGEKHILGAYQDGVVLRITIPVYVKVAAHEEMYGYWRALNPVFHGAALW